MHPIVFILGCPRSGTSAVAWALREALGYGGFDEGHIAPEILGLADKAVAMVAGVRESLGRNDRSDPTHNPRGATYMTDALRAIDLRAHFARMLRNIYAEILTPPWCEKTPGAPMLAALPQLAVAFPEARFIYMHRRLHEVVASHRRKFADISALDAASHWAHCKELWDQHAGTLRNRSIEIDQRDLLLTPFATAERLHRFLCFDESLVGRVVRQFAYRFERTSEDTAVPLSSDELGLSPQVWAEIRSRTHAAMAAYGYDFERKYRLRDPKAAYLARGDQGVTLHGQFAREGDTIVLVAGGTRPPISFWAALPRVDKGRRLRAVVVSSSGDGAGLRLKIGASSSSQNALQHWECDLTEATGGELDIALPSSASAEVRFEPNVPSGGRPLRIELRALRLEHAGAPPEGASAFPVRANSSVKAPTT